MIVDHVVIVKFGVYSLTCGSLINLFLNLIILPYPGHRVDSQRP